MNRLREIVRTVQCLRKGLLTLKEAEDAVIFFEELEEYDKCHIFNEAINKFKNEKLRIKRLR